MPRVPIFQRCSVEPPQVSFRSTALYKFEMREHHDRQRLLDPVANFPVAAYQTWNGTRIEGLGLEPDTRHPDREVETSA